MVSDVEMTVTFDSMFALCSSSKIHVRVELLLEFIA